MEEIDIDEEEKIINQEFNRLNQEPNTLGIIFGVIGFISSLGLSYFLDVIYIWIPASFLLMIVWFSYSAIKFYQKGLAGNKPNTNLKIIKKFSSDFELYVSRLFMKNVIAMMKAVTAIFAVNLIIVVAHLFELIHIPYNYLEIVVIIIVSGVFSIGIFCVDRFNLLVDKVVLPSMKSLKQFTLPMIICAVLFLIISVLVLVISLFIISSSVSNWKLLVSIGILQFVTIIFLHSYISFKDVKTELHHALNKIRDIKDGKFSIERLPEFVQFTRYDIQDSLKFIHIYVFQPHPIYVKQVLVSRRKRRRMKK